MAWAHRAPALPELPNDDRRPAAAVSAEKEAGFQQGLVRVRLAVPNVQVSRDPLLGTPSWVHSTRGFLSTPGGQGARVSSAAAVAVPADPHGPVKAFLNSNSALFGHDASALAGSRVKRDYVTAHNGMRTVIWEQMFQGVPVYEALVAGNITGKGELVTLSSRFVSHPAQAALQGDPDYLAAISDPGISAANAISLAAADLGGSVDSGDLTPLAEAQGVERTQAFRGPGVRGEAHAKLVWLPLSQDSLRLCWRVEVSSKNRPELYSLVVDAKTGQVLVRKCLTNYATPASYLVYTSDSPSPFSPGWPSPNSAQPPVVPRTLVALTAFSTNASPAGWINDGDNETMGNNVDAHTDIDDNDSPDLPRPSGSPNRVFSPALDLATPPSSYSDAAVVNLFYWNNLVHDKLYDLGFTEAAGNFQNDNFGRGGESGDAVQADAQDGSGTDNANFSTPPDGQPGRMQMYVFTGPNPDRDGDLDVEIVIHEYVHGLSNRLVGGGVGISSLQPGGMGEGWSDFYGLCLLSQPEDDVDGNYAVGGYATYQFFGLNENYYYGIRRYPYSTDLSRNPLTLKDIDPTKADPHVGVPTSPIAGGGPADEVHNMGEVWCVTLWEARANLIEKLGFDEGNRTILQLVTDGMKLAPANPTFLQARNAILLADEVYSGGDNRGELWVAFAKRGMGVNAVVPAANTAVGVIEDFSIPDDIVVTVPDGILEVTVNPPSRSALFAGTTQPVFIRVRDGGGITNATVTATLSVPGSLVFLNDGTAPDVTANNSVYSGNLTVPSAGTDLSVTLVIEAPGKETTTNVLTYTVIVPPTNDNFADAIKVPSGGATYVSNNQLATVEEGEPQHAGAQNSAASLWWIWASGETTNVLVDTGGSLFNSVIGVYSGSSLEGLTEVASANDPGGRRQAFVSFNAVAGVSYRIAVASFDTNSTGTVNLRVTPGGQADITRPIVTITSPPSGLALNTNRVTVTGGAVDPQPGASGIDQITIRVQAGLSDSEVIVPPPGSNSLVESTNWTQVVVLSEGVNTIEVRASDVDGNASLPATVQVTYIRRDPENDLFVNATGLTGNSGISSVNTTRATRETGEPLIGGNLGGHSAWWTFTPATDGVLSLTTTNSSFDTLLGLYLGNQLAALTSIAQNDEAYADSGFSQITQAVQAGQKYRIAVDGFDGASGVVYLTYSFAPAAVYSLSVSASSGGSVTPGSGNFAANSPVVLTAVPATGYQFSGWQGTVASTDNPLSLVVVQNTSLTAVFELIPLSDGFELGNFLELPWTSSGNAPWIVQNQVVAFGQFAARSGAIGNSQSSRLNLSVNSSGGPASFDYKVSSEPTWDQLTFLVNGAAQQSWSGEAGWASYSFTIPAGLVNLEWRYQKDASSSLGQDAAFVDNVKLPLVPTSLQLINPTTTGFQIQAQCQPNQALLVQSSTNLVTWRTDATNVATGSVIQFNYPQPAGNRTRRFYRVVAP